MNEFVGTGKLNEWHIAYDRETAQYMGGIYDDSGRQVFHVPEQEALVLVELLNGLCEALADIADVTDSCPGDEEYYIRADAYDKLLDLKQIVGRTPLKDQR